MDWTTLTPWMLQSLNAPSVPELTDWTETELYQYAEEVFRDLGARYLLMAKYDDTTALASGQALYPVLGDHVTTIFCAADGVMLEPCEVEEMEAFDDDYEEAASAAAPTKWIGNWLGLEYVRVYPPKNAAGVLIFIYQQQPPTMPLPAVGQPLEIKMPAPIGDFLTIKALEQARRRQGDGQMLDAAGAFGKLGQIYEKAIAAYWGSGE